MKKILGAAACVATLAACGGSNPTTYGADASTYRSAALQVSAAVTGYGTTSTGVTTPAECSAALQQLQGQVEPVLQGMGPMATRMDDAMQSMGQMTGADQACGFTMMQQVMQQYAGTACSSTDAAANRAAATQFVATMQDLADHMQLGAQELSQLAAGGMMEGGMMRGGAATAAATGSWTTPDGRTMSWGDPMPGCTLVNGTFQPSASASAGSGTSSGSATVGG